MATLGHYEQVRELGEGGMATVYEAVDQRIGRTVALKVLTLPFYLSQTQRQVLIARLMREARAAGRLSHPNIVTIFDVGEQDGHHYIAMEYLQGGSLRSRLEEGPLSPRDAVDILAQVASGLDHAHALGVLHRDIKPSNVMLLPDGRVKLTDFGVARQADDAKLTQTGVPVGSPAYMAPEQVRGEQATTATDRWSLGVLMYEMLAGQPPFASESIPAVLHQVAYHPTPPIPGLPRPLQAVLDRALAKEPARRFETAQGMAVAFQEAVAHSAGSFRVTPGQDREPAGRTRAFQEAHQTQPLAGAKGGEVAARPSVASGGTRWLWALPALALLLAAPLALHQFGSRPASTATRSALKPAANRTATRPVPRGQPDTRASVEVTEVTPRRQPAARAGKSRPEATARSAKRAITGSGARRDARRAAGTRQVGRADGPAERSRSHRPTVQTATQRDNTSSLPITRHRPTERTRSRLVSAERNEGQSRKRSRIAASTPVAEVASLRPTETTSGRRESRRSSTTTRRQTGSHRSATALDLQGYRLLRRGRPAAAEPVLREAVRRNPNYAYAQYNLGWSLLAQGKTREALGPLQRTAAQQPRRWEPQFRLAQAYERLGQHDRARAAYARARALRGGRRSRSPSRRQSAGARAGTSRSNRVKRTAAVERDLPAGRRDEGEE